ncbi:hypothetical protein OOU_Y34scaffold00725g7 [Pyricularia oryzae Y34]|uniref:Uncharacterized protein n=1 Tax=Pyricularia oryzae (strain Y34) TaxID=1143189 RepID=A0AA97PHU4_PYRO3|nr:hypothetical protein OOU_Y34scaffold00725g7 [Pyricularia oryzae Y34]
MTMVSSATGSNCSGSLRIPEATDLVILGCECAALAEVT